MTITPQCRSASGFGPRRLRVDAGAPQHIQVVLVDVPGGWSLLRLPLDVVGLVEDDEDDAVVEVAGVAFKIAVEITRRRVLTAASSQRPCRQRITYAAERLVCVKEQDLQGPRIRRRKISAPRCATAASMVPRRLRHTAKYRSYLRSVSRANSSGHDGGGAAAIRGLPGEDCSGPMDLGQGFQHESLRSVVHISSSLGCVYTVVVSGETCRANLLREGDVPEHPGIYSSSKSESLSFSRSPSVSSSSTKGSR